MKKILFLVLFISISSYCQRRILIDSIGEIVGDTLAINPDVIVDPTPVLTPVPVVPSSTAFCFNNMTTNPTAPVNTQFPNYLNNFNWQTNTAIPYNTPSNPNSFTPNPFLSNQVDFSNIAIQQDFKAIDGWEAVTYNLGYDQNNVALAAPSQHSYFLLYNKHRGVLRILLKWSGLVSTFNQSLLTLQFAPGFQTNLLDMTTYEKPLLAPHIPNPKYTTTVKFFNGVSNWSYADFKVNYDPCSCDFTEISRLQLYTNLIQNSSVSLSGTITGTISSISNGVSQGADSTSGNFWKDVNSTNATVAKVFKGANDFVTKYEGIYTKLKDNGVTVNAIQQLGNFMKTNSFLKAGLAAVPYVGQAVSFISSFFGGGAGAIPAAPQELAPMAVDLSIKLNGTISFNAPMHNFEIGLPGSTNSAVLPGVYGGQPLYNEALGVFSLVDIPTMYYTEETQVKDFYARGGDLLGNYRYYGYDFTFRRYKMDGSQLRYIINPASKLILQDAQFMVVAEYEKPALKYKSYDLLRAYGSYKPPFTTVNVDPDNGLLLPIQYQNYGIITEPIAVQNSIAQSGSVYNRTSTGNPIDSSNYIFQNAFPVIGEKIFKNNYEFSYLHKVSPSNSRRADGSIIQNNSNEIGYVNSSDHRIGFRASSDYPVRRHDPKPEYLAPQVKRFNLKVILNLKRTDNPNAQNVLYTVTYPMKTVVAPTGYNMTGTSYAIDAQAYVANPAGTSNIFVPFTGDLHELCSSTAYRNGRVGSQYRLAGQKSEKLSKENDVLIGDTQLVAYPNPVTDILNVKYNGATLINIVGVDGKELKTFNTATNIKNLDVIEIDFSQYKSGLYFVNYKDALLNSKTLKIIKK